MLKGLEPRLSVAGDGKTKHLLIDNKLVVAAEDAPKIIQDYDLNPRFGGGRDRLYWHISRNVAGITRRMVSEYIGNSESHQLLRPKPKVLRHRAIITSDVGKKAQVDLIGPLENPGLNNNYNYILTFVDLFSKFCAARPLKSKKGGGVIAGVDSILEKMKPEHRPRVLQADNGGEFSTTFERHVKNAWGVKVVHSSPFKPSTNGAIERLNGTLKQLLFSNMARYDSKRWVDLLDSVIDNINNTRHSVTGHTPLEALENSAVRSEVAENIKKAAEERKHPEDIKEKELSVGDHVRVALATRSSVRKGQLFAKSAGKQHWTNRIYTVGSISKPALDFQRPQYKLKYGGRVLTKQYYASQLQKVNMDKLVKDKLSIDERPVYDEALPNQEHLLRVDLPSREVIPVDLEAKKREISEGGIAKTRQKREIRLPKRYRD